jgi:hypothetical protein
MHQTQFARLLHSLKAAPLAFCLCVLIFFFPAYMLGDLVNKAYFVIAAQYITGGFADALDKGEAPAPLSQRSDLAFFCLQSANGKVIYAMPPNLPASITRLNDTSFMSFNGSSVYRTVRALNDGKILKLGLITGSQETAAFHIGPELLAKRITMLHLATTIFFLTLFLCLFIYVTITYPLAQIRSSIELLLNKPLNKDSKESPLDFLENLKLFPPAVSDSEDLIAVLCGLKEKFRQLNQTKEAPLQSQARWRSASLELEKATSTGDSISSIGDTGNFRRMLSKKISSTNFQHPDELLLDFGSCIMDSFRLQVTGVIFFKPQNSQGSLSSQQDLLNLGLTANAQSLLTTLKHDDIQAQLAISKVTRELGGLFLNRLGLDRVLPYCQASTVLFMPLLLGSKGLGLALLFLRQSVSPSQLKEMEGIWLTYAPTHQQLLLSLEASEADFQDNATGLRNRKFLLERVQGFGPEYKQLSMAVFGAFQFSQHSGLEETMPLNDDSFANILKQFQSKWELADTAGLAIRLARLDEHEFALLVENGSGQTRLMLIERLQRFILDSLRSRSEQDCVISCGYCDLEVAGSSRKTNKDILREAHRAFEFAKTRAKINAYLLVAAQEVPADFEGFSAGGTLKGKLGIFDASEILQSVSSGDRTGKFEVFDDEGSGHFELFLNQGKPVTANFYRNGQCSFRSENAIIEYITTFKTGAFAFTAMPSVKAQGLPQAMPKIFNCLMEAALQLDHLEQARGVLDLNRPVCSQFNIQLFQELCTKEELSSLEIDTIKEIGNRGQSATTLAAIFESLSNTLTAQKWHCAALMKAYGLLSYL